MQRTIGRVAKLLEIHMRLERLVRTFDSALEPANISYHEFRALGCILSVGPITLKEVADSVGTPKTSMHYALGKLERSGQIQRVPSRKRSAPAFLVTQSGRSLWSQAAHLLMLGPVCKALEKAPVESLADVTAQLRCVDDLLRDSEQNRNVILESQVLAVAALEGLLILPEQTGSASFGPAKKEKGSQA